jgi:hypothetical protein
VVKDQDWQIEYARPRKALIDFTTPEINDY